LSAFAAGATDGLLGAELTALGAWEAFGELVALGLAGEVA